MDVITQDTPQSLTIKNQLDNAQRFREFTQLAGDWCWESDENHCCSFLTDNFEAATGLPAAAFLGKPLRIPVLQDDQHVIDTIEACQKAHQPFNKLACRLVVKEGSHIWIEHSAVPRYDSNGVFLGFRGTGKIVTTEKELELALKLNEERFRDFAETGNDWCWEADTDLRFTYLSPSFRERMGLDPETVLGKRQLPFELHPDDLDLVLQTRAKVKARLPIERVAYRRLREDGSVLWIQMSAKPIFDAQGQYCGYRGNGKIVTAEKELERALKLSEERFRDFAETGNDWCWETDAERNVTYLSPSFEQQFGLKPTMLVGRKRLGYDCHPDDQRVVDELIAAMDAHRPLKQVIYRRFRPDGSVFWVQLNGKPLFNSKGQFCGYRGSGMIVTEEEERKQALRLATKVLRHFAEASSDWFWETDSELRICQTKGLPDDIIRDILKPYSGCLMTDIDVHPEDISKLHDCLKVMQEQQPFRNVRFRKRGENGEWIWLNMRGNPIFDEQSRFSGYRGALTDETKEALQKQLAIRQSLELERSQTIAKIGHCRYNLGADSMEWSVTLYDITGFDSARTPPSFLQFRKYVHPEDQARFDAALTRAMEGREVPHLEFRFFPLKRNTQIHCRLKILVETLDGRPVAVFGIIQDITDLKTTEILLAERSKELGEAQRLGKIGDWSHKFNAPRVVWGRELFELLRYDPETFDTTVANVAEFFVGSDYTRILETQRDAMNSDDIRRIDVKGRRGDGTVGDYVLSTRPLKDNDGVIIGLAGTLQDISDRKQSEEQLRKLAYFDPLTGLANRALFTRQIEPIVATAELCGDTGALFLLNLDRFKEVNDSLGHASGDELLCHVARILQNTLSSHHFLARLGGDEFAIIVPRGATETSIRRLSETIIDKLAEPVHLERGEVHIGLSIGVALIPQDGNTIETLLRSADLALDQAKENGRGCVSLFTPALNLAAQNKISLERDLRTAQLTLEGIESRYQPQIELLTNRVVGFETLMRWYHPQRGYVPPTEFIPIAESAGLIGKLGLWILRDSVKQAKAWIDRGEVARKVSVNVSAAQIWQTDIVADIARVLEESSLPPGLLCLELTESLFADHSEDRIIKTLHALKSLGVTLAIDDFGTGYSSLGYLNQLPFDKLKIDRVFVDGIVGSTRKRKLLEGIIALGHGLGMTVIAEGAERAEELEILGEFGCDLVQGYVFSKPVPAEEAMSFALNFENRTREAQSILILQDSPSIVAPVDTDGLMMSLASGTVEAG